MVFSSKSLSNKEIEATYPYLFDSKRNSVIVFRVIFKELQNWTIPRWPAFCYVIRLSEDYTEYRMLWNTYVQRLHNVLTEVAEKKLRDVPPRQADQPVATCLCHSTAIWRSYGRSGFWVDNSIRTTLLLPRSCPGRRLRTPAATPRSIHGHVPY